MTFRISVLFFSFQHKINFKTVMDLKKPTPEQLLSLLKRRNVPQEAVDSLKHVNGISQRVPSIFLKLKLDSGIFSADNGIDGSTLLLLRDDMDEFMAVVPKSGHRLLIKRITKEEQAREDLEAQVSM